ncbi:MAG: hypothetical protein SP4CHLAM5_07120 [Chlamydiia bacterium]|nr:hypothetical protein [Chlamydiia bacterium]MCH9618579.1 hypothetical protein [Chlamydiia bacterium]MCH9623882.1 hypothetical protein [Chlamydiia bacterium]
MNKNLKRLIPLFALACCATTTAFAYDSNDEHKEHKSMHAVPPPQHPGGPDALSFYVGAAYTYWAPYQEGMNLAIGEPTTGTTVRGNVLKPAMNAASGFKVSLGANTHHDGWNAEIAYTWFYYSPSMKDHTILTGVTYRPTFNAIDEAYSSLKSQFKTQFNRIDLTVDRSFYAGHYMTFRPWMGLLAAWDTQNLNFIGNTSSTVTQQAYKKQTWWGIGPYAGGEGTYYFTNDWGLFIKSGVSLLLSDRTVYNNNLNYTDGVAASAVANNKATDYGVDPMFETELGLRWDSNWTDWALRIDLGWQLQTYFNHNGFLGYYSGAGNMGTFAMQGLTLAVRVNF